MLIPSFKKPTSGDFPDADPWYWKVVKTTVEQIQNLTNAVQRKLTQNENFNCDVRDFEIRSGQEVTIKPQGISGKPSSVEVVHTDPQFFRQASGRIVSNDEVRLTVHFSSVPNFSGAAGTVPTDPVTTRVRIWGN